jgi:hypothetical protein
MEIGVKMGMNKNLSLSKCMSSRQKTTIATLHLMMLIAYLVSYYNITFCSAHADDLPNLQTNANQIDQADLREREDESTQNPHEQIFQLFPQCERARLLVTDLLEFARPYVGAHFDLKNPTAILSEEAVKLATARYADLFTALDAHDLLSLPEAMSALQMNACTFGANHPDLIFFYGPAKNQGVQFFWRVGEIKIPGESKTEKNSVDPLILAAPHEGQDDVLAAAIALMDASKARLLFINAVEPRAGLPMNGATFFNTDGAQSKDTLFHHLYQPLLELYPDGLYVELHGDSTSSYNQLSNGLDGRSTTHSKSGPLLLSQAMVKYFPKRETKEMNLCAFLSFTEGENLQLQQACKRYSLTADYLSLSGQDSGRFLHWEIDSKWRRGPAAVTMMKKMAEIFSAVMGEWQKTGQKQAQTPPSSPL